jgi:hypothetical protein
MVVTTSFHFDDQYLVTLKEGQRLADPTPGFGVIGISTLAASHDEDVPEPVQLSVLTEEMLPTQLSWRHIPDPHQALLVKERLDPATLEIGVRSHVVGESSVKGALPTIFTVSAPHPASRRRLDQLDALEHGPPTGAPVAGHRSTQLTLGLIDERRSALVDSWQ